MATSAPDFVSIFWLALIPACSHISEFIQYLYVANGVAAGKLVNLSVPDFLMGNMRKIIVINL